LRLLDKVRGNKAGAFPIWGSLANAGGGTNNSAADLVNEVLDASYSTSQQTYSVYFNGSSSNAHQVEYNIAASTCTMMLQEIQG
jgi:hypothetical protein